MASKYPESEAENYTNIDTLDIKGLKIDTENIPFSELDTVEPRIRDILYRPMISKEEVIDRDTYNYVISRLQQKQNRIVELINEMTEDITLIDNNREIHSLDVIWGRDAKEEEEENGETIKETI
jgi:hypothetical protein